MKRYVFSDIHGSKDLWNQIKSYVNKDDWLYCLGDVIDRGPAGVEIFLDLYKRPNTIILRGNHEDMAAAAVPPLLAGTAQMDGKWLNEHTKHGEIENAYVLDWYNNGGILTWRALQKYSKEEIQKIRDIWATLPTSFIVYDDQNHWYYYLDHCGFTPSSRAYRLPYWDRLHFDDEWDDWADGKNVRIIHGHTPVQSFESTFCPNGFVRYTTLHPEDKRMINYIPQMTVYCGGHKVDIDLAAIDSGRTMLLDLDKFEPIYFTT